MRQFFMSIPKDLYDAAKIDGCSDLRFIITILIPLARPAIGTLAVYRFLQTYNQYSLAIADNEQNLNEDCADRDHHASGS